MNLMSLSWLDAVTRDVSNFKTGEAPVPMVVTIFVDRIDYESPSKYSWVHLCMVLSTPYFLHLYPF